MTIPSTATSLINLYWACKEAGGPGAQATAEARLHDACAQLTSQTGLTAPQIRQHVAETVNDAQKHAHRPEYDVHDNAAQREYDDVLARQLWGRLDSGNPPRFGVEELAPDQVCYDDHQSWS